MLHSHAVISIFSNSNNGFISIRENRIYFSEFVYDFEVKLQNSNPNIWAYTSRIRKKNYE